MDSENINEYTDNDREENTDSLRMLSDIIMSDMIRYDRMHSKSSAMVRNVPCGRELPSAAAPSANFLRMI